MSQEVPVEIVSIEQIEGGGGSIIINCNNGEVFSIEKPIDENLLYGLNYNIYNIIDNGTKDIRYGVRFPCKIKCFIASH